MDAVLQGLGSPMLQSLSGNHMFFHLKEVAEQATFTSSHNVSCFVSDIEFTEDRSQRGAVKPILILQAWVSLTKSYRKLHLEILTR